MDGSSSGMKNLPATIFYAQRVVVRSQLPSTCIPMMLKTYSGISMNTSATPSTSGANASANAALKRWKRPLSRAVRNLLKLHSYGYERDRHEFLEIPAYLSGPWIVTAPCPYPAPHPHKGVCCYDARGVCRLFHICADTPIREVRENMETYPLWRHE